VLPQGPIIAESRYNSNYFCNVLGVEWVGDNEVDIKFEVFGDGSLGPLQVPGLHTQLHHVRNLSIATSMQLRFEVFVLLVVAPNYSIHSY
jgi:hypothetical protein